MAIGAAAAIAVVGLLVESSGAAQGALNEARRQKAQNKARIKQMQDQFDLSTQNLYNNNISIKQNKLKNDMLIEESKLESQDAFTQAFIGSGVSGRTQDIMAAELRSEVSKAHNEAQGIATKEADRQFLGLIRQSQAQTTAIDNLMLFDASAAEANNNMAMLSSGISKAGSIYGRFGSN